MMKCWEDLRGEQACVCVCVFSLVFLCRLFAVFLRLIQNKKRSESVYVYPNAKSLLHLSIHQFAHALQFRP